MAGRGVLYLPTEFRVVLPYMGEKKHYVKSRLQKEQLDQFLRPAFGNHKQVETRTNAISTSYQKWNLQCNVSQNTQKRKPDVLSSTTKAHTEVLGIGPKIPTLGWIVSPVLCKSSANEHLNH